MDIPLIEILLDVSEKDIQLDKIKKVPVGGIICCARCNTPLSEGPIKKGKIEVQIVDEEIDKIKLAIQWYNTFGHDIFFILKNKKEMLNLQASIGNQGNWGTAKFIDEFVEELKLPNIFMTSLIPFEYFEHPKNYLVCLTESEYDLLRLSENQLHQQFENKFIVKIVS